MRTQLLGQPEICKPNVAVLSEQDVFRLQVPIDDRLRVKELQRDDDLGRVECHLILSEAPLLL